MLSLISHFVLNFWFIALPIGTLAYFISNKYRYGINKYPGPWLAAYTDWWRFYDTWRGTPHTTILELHRRYGDIVRIGPNALSFADPKALKSIYGLNKGFVKVTPLFPVRRRLNALLTMRYNSLNSIRSKMVSSRGGGYPHSSLLWMRTSIPATAGVSIMHSA
jgi:hypothetical protein